MTFVMQGYLEKAGSEDECKSALLATIQVGERKINMCLASMKQPCMLTIVGLL